MEEYNFIIKRKVVLLGQTLAIAYTSNYNRACYLWLSQHLVNESKHYSRQPCIFIFKNLLEFIILDNYDLLTDLSTRLR